MGTRGLMAFAVDGELKGTYNHFDSYPSGLGQDLVDFIQENELDKVREQARALKVVSEDTPPTDGDIARLSAYHDSGVSTGSPREWYSLLRHTQGNAAATLESGVIIDGNDFARDSLFCEWGYVIDLDSEMFEIYQGFQKEPHEEGRFAHLEPIKDENYAIAGRYYPIKLVAAYSLREIPPDVMNKLEEELYGEDDD